MKLTGSDLAIDRAQKYPQSARYPSQLRLYKEVEGFIFTSLSHFLVSSFLSLGGFSLTSL